MKSLDTNVLARSFIDDPDDAQALRQRPAAVIALSEPAYVTATVLLEFEAESRRRCRTPCWRAWFSSCLSTIRSDTAKC